MNDVSLQKLVDDLALRRSAELYAYGADHRDKPTWAAILAADCVIEGPGFRMEGREQSLGAIDHLRASFKATLHRIHNQVATVSGDSAEGETYCTADHLMQQDGKDVILSWNIRYQDRWQREDGVWKFTHRTLIVDWEEVRPVNVKVGS